MSDDLYRERVNRDRIRPSRPEPEPPGTTRWLGKVASATSAIGAGKFVMLNPCTVLGAEVEGGSPAIGVNTTVSYPVVLLNGSLSLGDYALARLVDYRWVT